MTYHSAGTQETECYYCGEVKMCEVIVADYPERETGYVDEFAQCNDCAIEPKFERLPLN